MSLCEIDQNEENLMHIAVRARQVESAKCLLEMARNDKVLGFFFSQQGNSGKTALDLAYETKQTAIVELFQFYLPYLVEEVENPKLDVMLLQEDEDGNTPLHAAVFHNSETNIAKKFVKLAIALDIIGKMLNARNNHKLAVYELAQLLDKQQFCELLLKPSDDKSVPTSKEAIQFYYLKTLKVNGNNILQEHIAAQNVNSIKNIKLTAQTVDGLWTKMLSNRNYDRKTALEMSKEDEIRSLLQ